MNKNLQLLFKWGKMLSGNSVFHVRQSAGLYYNKDYVRGYYSDLRHKVTGNTLLDDKGVPINITNQGKQVYFAITIFQYGLGAYDLYLETKDMSYLNTFQKIASWALKTQESLGGWDAFSFKKNAGKYSSMAQGEGASLLLRAYLETDEDKYLLAAKKAIDFMLIDIEEGGTTLYENNKKFTFEESVQYKTILNGVIFSIWGLLDYVRITNDSKYAEILDNATKHLASILPLFDRGYWSDYDLEGNITSPFYHDLHLEQLRVMYDLFDIKDFKIYHDKWSAYQNTLLKRKVAFFIKAIQKIRFSNSDITLVK